MKVLIFFACLVAASTAFQIPHLERLFLNQCHQQCLPESHCGLDFIRHPFSHFNYEPLERYILCIAVKYGFMHPNGHFNFDILREKLGLACQGDNPLTFIKMCAVPHLFPRKAAFNLFQCLHNHGFHYLDNIYGYGGGHGDPTFGLGRPY